MKRIIIVLYSMCLFCSASGQNKQILYEDSNTAGIVSESALKVSMNNLLNIPTVNQILYSNGTNLVGSANLLYDATKLYVSGTGDSQLHLNKASGTTWNYLSYFYGGTRQGYFGIDSNADFTFGLDGTNKSIKLVPTGTGTVDFAGKKGTNIANGTVAADAINLSQLQSSISGTSGFYAKFTGVNTVGNGLLQDVSTTHYKTSGKSYLNEYTTNSCTFKDLMFYDDNTASITGAFVIETGITNLIADKMVNIKISGYQYSGNGAWEVMIGGYTYNTTIDTWLNHSALITGRAPFSTVQLAHNVATGKYVIILGTTSTVWAYPKIQVTEMLAGYGTAANSLATGWSGSIVTSLAAYTGIVTPSLSRIIYGYGAGALTGTNAKSLNVTSSGALVEGMPMPTATLSVNQIPYSNGTTFIGGTGLTYTGSAFNVTGTGTFSGIVTAADATAATHLVNRQTGDARYLGIAATAANTTLLNSQAASFYTNATNISTGTLADARLSINIPLKNAATNVFTGDTYSYGLYSQSKAEIYLNGSTGGINMNIGDASKSGRINFFSPNQGIGGYIGDVQNSGSLTYNATNGNHSFNGNVSATNEINAAQLKATSSATSTTNTQVYTVGTGGILDKQDVKTLPISPQKSTISLANNAASSINIDFENEVSAVKPIEITFGNGSVNSSTITSSNMKNGATYTVYWNSAVFHDVTYSSTYFKKADGSALATCSTCVNHILTFTVINGIAYLTTAIGATSW